MSRTQTNLEHFPEETCQLMRWKTSWPCPGVLYTITSRFQSCLYSPLSITSTWLNFSLTCSFVTNKSCLFPPTLPCPACVSYEAFIYAPQKPSDNKNTATTRNDWRHMYSNPVKNYWKWFYRKKKLVKDLAKSVFMSVYGDARSGSGSSAVSAL